MISSTSTPRANIPSPMPTKSGSCARRPSRRFSRRPSASALAKARDLPLPTSSTPRSTSRSRACGATSAARPESRRRTMPPTWRPRSAISAPRMACSRSRSPRRARSRASASCSPDFGSGCDALVLEMTAPMPGAESAEEALRQGLAFGDYVRFLSLERRARTRLGRALGIRAEGAGDRHRALRARHDRLRRRSRRGRERAVPEEPHTGPARRGRPGADGGRPTCGRSRAHRFGHRRPAELHARSAVLVRTRPVRQRRAGNDGIHRRGLRAAFPSATGCGCAFASSRATGARGFRTYFWKAAPAERPMLGG